MSVETDLQYDLSDHATGRSIARIARGIRIDPRIPAIVPGFDVPFFQAGLAGYSDAAMRLIARRHGCPFCVTEALLDRTLINGGKGRRKEDPDLLAEECGTGDVDENRPVGQVSDLSGFLRLSEPQDIPSAPARRAGETTHGSESRATGSRATWSHATLSDHPIAGQIMGSGPDEMARGSAILVGMGYDVIDVNLACPVKKIRRRARGGHLMQEPAIAIDILRAVHDAVPRGIPITVKLRRGWDDSPQQLRHFEIIFDKAYEIGCAWAAVHCRTVEQKYKGPGRWPFLRELVARYPDRLIFGSGDVWRVEDIFAMLELTGVSAVSVARGCIGNPWIFRQAREMMGMAGGTPAPLTPALPDLREQRQALLEHFHLAVVLHGEQAASRMMRKFGIKFSRHHPRSEDVKAEFIRCKSVAEWKSVIERWYSASVMEEVPCG